MTGMKFIQGSYHPNYPIERPTPKDILQSSVLLLTYLPCQKDATE